MRSLIETLFVSQSSRVKAVDIHPKQPLILASLFNGDLQLWNYQTKELVKTVNICDMPVRACKFIVREDTVNWIVTGSDDQKIRVIDGETFDVLLTFEAHDDFIRSLAVHPTLPYLISAGDDGMIKIWDWDNQWAVEQIFIGHENYVMCVALNPNDPDMFATASLDLTVKLWRIGEENEVATLKGHTAPVNCVDFYGDEQLVSGSDDTTVKIWNWKTGEECDYLPGHRLNVTSVRVCGSILISASEDSSAIIWNMPKREVLKMLNHEVGRVWCVQVKEEADSKTVVIGADSGTVALTM